MNAYYLLIALFLFQFCNGQTSVRTINLDEYPVQSVEFKDAGIAFQRISQTHETDTLRITRNLFSIFRLSYIDKASGPENEMESDECYGTVSISEDRTTLLKKDSIAMIGPLTYSAQYDKIIIPLILYQDQDNLYTALDLYLVDLQTKKHHRINRKLIFNCVYGCFADDGKSIIYGSFGKLLKYNLDNRTSECVIDFENPTLFIFKLTYEHHALSIYSYDNFIEEAFSPLQKRTIYNISL